LSFSEVFLTGIALSMDAFTVALCKGLGMRKIDIRQSVIISLFFGVFQALMPFIGWMIGKQFENAITAFDHWIAFVLLAFLGGRMIFDVFRGDTENAEPSTKKLNIKELLMLSVATSIDALAIGITFAFLGVSISPAVTVIGITTFCISFFGVAIGCKTGSRFKDKAQIAGGIILIAIGTKILAEHLFFY